MISSSDPEKNDATTIPKSNDSSQENEDILAVPVTSSKPSPAKLQRAETGKQPDHPKPWWRSVPGWRIFEGIGIAAGIAYAVVTIIQWRDLRHNFEADERSWVKLEFEWKPLQTGEGQAAVAIGTLTNVGKSPIGTLYGEGAFEVVDSDKSPSFSLKQYHSRHHRVLLFPASHSDEFPIFLMDTSVKKPRLITPEEAGKLTQGKAYLAVFGWIVYIDQFGAHWYRFCDWGGAAAAPPFSTANSNVCINWNQIGDGKLPAPIQ